MAGRFETQLVSASGKITTNYRSTYLVGNVHDHVINYKYVTVCSSSTDFLTPSRVDLDIAGLENSLLQTSTVQETLTMPWFDDDEWGSTVIQQKIIKNIIEMEDEALLKYPMNFQGHCSIPIS
jgi:primary-amine oxidase